MLSLTWNAERIGSMANWADPDRQKKLPLEQPDDPAAVIHFSGPRHPAIIDALVPSLHWQPFVAKPWGHLYAED